MAKPKAKKPVKKEKTAKKTVAVSAGKVIRKTASAPVKAVKAVKALPPAPPPIKMAKNKLPEREKKEIREMLGRLREMMSGQIRSLTDDSLQRFDSVNSEEDGTDAFERQLALNLASSERDSILEIDDALRRVDDNTYGVCEECGQLIGKARLKALPFVRMCIKCKAENEKNAVRIPQAGQTSVETQEPPAEDSE